MAYFPIGWPIFLLDGIWILGNGRTTPHCPSPDEVWAVPTSGSFKSPSPPQEGFLEFINCDAELAAKFHDELCRVFNAYVVRSVLNIVHVYYFLLLNTFSKFVQWLWCSELSLQEGTNRPSNRKNRPSNRILYIILYKIYKIWYKIWYGGPARHAGLAGRPIFFLEGPRAP